MEQTAVNRSVHTGCKQHRICTQICLGILCERELRKRRSISGTKKDISRLTNLQQIFKTVCQLASFDVACFPDCNECELSTFHFTDNLYCRKTTDGFYCWCITTTPFFSMNGTMCTGEHRQTDTHTTLNLYRNPVADGGVLGVVPPPLQAPFAQDTEHLA